MTLLLSSKDTAQSIIDDSVYHHSLLGILPLNVWPILRYLSRGMVGQFSRTEGDHEQEETLSRLGSMTEAIFMICCIQCPNLERISLLSIWYSIRRP
jgi:hypothetical protein